MLTPYITNISAVCVMVEATKYAFSRIMRLSSPNQGSWQCPEISRVMNDLTKNPEMVCIASVLEVSSKLATGFLVHHGHI